MPAARFLQDARLASEGAAKVERESWRVAAFLGWQTASAFGALEKGSTFEKYARNLGLADEVKPVELSREEREREIAKAQAVTARAKARFKGGATKAFAG